MKILVTGLCTLHWGRLEFGNIGNFYIVQPLFRELHRVFPNAELITTFQMTDEFVARERITVVPMEYYYSWNGSDVDSARTEYELVKRCGETIDEERLTPYIACVRECSLVINVSGDMWGDNAEHVGHGRFLVDLYKMAVAQLLHRKTVLFAGTPGPFSDQSTREFARRVYESFSLVINREPTSSMNLKKWNFISEHVKDFACPAFLFEPELEEGEIRAVDELFQKLRSGDHRLLVGFTIGGFNMPVGPYDMWPREDSQYEVFAEAIEMLTATQNARVVLISHTNGFELPPNFKLINGRDYPILKQLESVIKKRGNIDSEKDIICLEGPYLPKITKAVIGRFDVFVTGRVHASVAAVTQCVPTVFITYEKSFIPSSKMHGFSSLAGVGELVCEPGNKEEMLEKIEYCCSNRSKIRKRLEHRIPEIQSMARAAFDEIRGLME